MPKAIAVSKSLGAESSKVNQDNVGNVSGKAKLKLLSNLGLNGSFEILFEKFDELLEKKFSNLKDAKYISLLKNCVQNNFLEKLERNAAPVGNGLSHDDFGSYILLKECGFFEKFTKPQETSNRVGSNLTFSGQISDLFFRELNSILGSKKRISSSINNMPSTYIVYMILSKLKMIPKSKQKQIEKFVKFIGMISTNSYQIIGNNFDNSHKTIYGLSRFLNTNFIYECLGELQDGDTVLSDDLLTKTKVNVNGTVKYLSEISDQRKKTMVNAEKSLNQLIEGKYVLEMGGKKYILDLGTQGNSKNNYLPLGFEICGKYGYGIIKVFQSGDIVIYDGNGIDSKELNNYGQSIGSNMFKSTKEDRKDLKEFLKLFKGDKSIISAFRSTLNSSLSILLPSSATRGLTDSGAILNSTMNVQSGELKEQIRRKRAEELTKEYPLKRSQIQVGGIYPTFYSRNHKAYYLFNFGIENGNYIDGAIYRQNLDEKGLKTLENLELFDSVYVKVVKIRTDGKIVLTFSNEKEYKAFQKAKK